MLLLISKRKILKCLIVLGRKGRLVLCGLFVVSVLFGLPDVGLSWECSPVN